MHRLLVTLLALGCASSVTGGDASPDACGTGSPSFDDAKLTVSPTTHAFGGVAVGARSEPVKFTVTNIACAAATAITAHLEGSDEFAIVANTCGAPLSLEASCEVQVVFRPTSAGEKSGRLLAVLASTGSSFSVLLSGSGG